MCAGLVPVPAPAPDPFRRKHSVPRLRAIIEDAQVSLVLTTSGLETVLSELLIAKDGSQTEWVATDQPYDHADALALPSPNATSLAYLQYTSGSTAIPRGVMISHGNVLSHCKAMSLAGRVSDHSRSLCWLPYFHDYGLLHGIIAPFYAGIPAYLMSPLTFLRRPLRWLEAVSRYSITHSGGPNFSYESCLRAVRQQQEWQADLSTWVVASCGAEPIHPATVEQFIETFEPRGFQRTSFTPAYGLAEATLVVTMKRNEGETSLLKVEAEALAHSIVKESSASASGIRTLVGCGEPLEKTHVVIVNPTTQRVCQADEVGEVWLAGAGIAGGYWGRPEESDATFKATIAGSGAGHYLRTGDLGFIHRGELFLTGRLKDLIIVRGRNYYPHDLEWTVEQVHAGLRRGCGAAFSIESETGVSVVLVYEVEKKLAESEISEVMSGIRRALADEYELEVHEVVLVKSGSISRTSSGKIQRHACRADFESGRLAVVGASTLGNSGEHQTVELLSETPRTPVEEGLSDIWQDVLGGPQPRRDENFFTLGGNSLLAAQVVARIVDVFHVELPLSAVFEYPTISTLAARVSESTISKHTGETAVEGLGFSAVDKRHIPFVPLSSVPREGKIPLSFSQQRLWFLELVHPDSSINHISMGVRLRGPLSAETLERSVREIVHRHEILRTRFESERGEGFAEVSDEAIFTIGRHDFQTMTMAEQEIEVRQLLRTEARQPFDLARGPLFRVALAALDQGHYVLALTFHRLIADGWSLRVFCKELALAYESSSEAQATRLSKLSFQYADYANWNRTRLNQGLREVHREYWIGQLEGAHPPVELPADRPRPRIRTFEGGIRARSLSQGLAVDLDKFSQQQGVTTFMVLYAVFVTWLHRYTQELDVVIGSVVSGRRRVELEDMIGYCVNTVALRTELSDGLTGHDLLKLVRRVVTDAYDHQELPFEEVIEALSLRREGTLSPLFNVMIVVEDDPLSVFRVRDLEATHVSWEPTASEFDLVLMVVNKPLGMELALLYDASIFDDSTVSRMLGQIETLLGAFIKKPEVRLCELSLLGAEERRHILLEWNQTNVSVPSFSGIHVLIEAQVERTPDAIAVICGSESLTYRELNRRANRVAHALKALGVCADLPVGLCVERSVDGIVGLLGILKAGGGYVPLDPSFPDHRLRLMLDDAKVSIVLAQGHLRSHLGNYWGQVCEVEAFCNPTVSGSDENLTLPVLPDHLAYIMYTSGSTGRPKGVAVTHRSLVISLNARLHYYQEPVSGFLLTFSFGFDGSVTGIFWTLLQGGQLVIPSDTAHRDPTALAALVDLHHISHVVWVPTLYTAVLGDALNAQLESLRIVITAGESLPLELVRRHYQLLPHATLYNEYGPTEATVWCSVYQTTREEEGARVPIGKPINNMQIYVLDADMEPLPIGVPGELYVAGDCLAQGYVNQPQLTQERFLPHPHVAGTRLYRTGDRARYREDGNVEFLGRVDQQVKLRGYRIELGEAEYVLSNFPGVHQAAVLLRQDKPEQQRLVGYLTGRPELRTMLDQVRSYLEARLSPYMVPSVILWMEVMPLTATGKINRRALPVPEEIIDDSTARTAPRNPVEEALAELWKLVLGIGEASIHDNFFERGGHSLLATQLVSRMREAFEVDVSLRVFFERPTIVGLAEEVTRLHRGDRMASAMPPIVSVSRDQPLPLSYSQQRMWLMYRLAPEGTAYNMPFASRQMGPLNKPALRRTIDAICRRHEAFRTTFAMTGEGPVQTVSPFRPPHWVEVDLAQLPGEQRQREAARLVEHEANQPFDLEKGPLARFLLIAVESEDHVLVLTMHHIIGDQWSFGLIGSEFAFFYNAFCQGETPSVRPLPLQYADYAVWQRRCLTSDWLSTQSDYWQKRLAGLSRLALPTDFPRPAMQTFNGSHCMLELPASMIERLKQFSAERNATVFMTLLACFQILLGRYSSQTDVAVGSPIANRTQSAVESIIGSFVNTLVLRADLSGNPTFEKMLERVRDTALGAYAHQDFPFDKLVETLGSNRDHSSAPLVQVLFNLANAPIGEINVHGLSWVPFEVETGAAQFDLSLTIETEIARKAYLTFNTDLFERQTVERMLGQYKVLLHSALTNPKANISDLSMLTAPERIQLLQDWNRTEKDYPKFECFPQLFEGQVERTPDAVAVSMGREAVCYRDLNARANQLARYLQTFDVRAGVAVGICLERSLEMVIALMAVLKAGGAYVPLDPEYPPDRLRFMAEDAAVPIVLTSEGLSSLFDSRSCRMVCLDREQSRIAQEVDHNLSPTATTQDLAYILYTSGSTGQPKGVEIPHQALVNFLCSMQQEPGCSAQDVMVSVTTLSFDIAGLELYLPLLVGARVEIVNRVDAMDGWKLRTLCEAVQPTIMQATPATWRILIEAGWMGSDRLTVLCGGEALPPDLATALLDRTNALWNMYGPTETTIWSTIEKIEQADQEITIGRPIANTETYILDQFQQPVPVGVSGELYIGGQGVARGYRRRPELTKDRFVPHPFSTDPHARLYRTGDLVRYRSDGRIVHLGRLDHQVKIRGFRIELGEVEAVLGRYPSVRQAVVIAREGQQGLKQLAAYLVCQEGATPSPAELRAFVRTALPEYMTPSFFVFLESIPLTANNKVDVRALPAPGPSLSEGQAHVGPRDRTEVQLTALWQQVLEVPKIGIHDNFFDLGGHSLKAAQLFFLLEQVYGRHLPLATLFQAPTIAELAAVLSREQWIPPWQSLVAIQPNGTAVPIFMVPGVGGNVLIFAQLARLLGPDQPLYGLQARGLDGKEAPFTSVPEMARHYIGEIRAIRPQGPYILLGVCTGGLIAYEMAQQLFEQEQVATLIVMDTWHPASHRLHRPAWSMRLWLPVFVLWRTMGSIHSLLRLPIKEWGDFVQRKSERLMSFLERRTTEDELFVEFQVERVTQSTRQAVARYVVHKYPGRILNIIASRRNVAPTVVDTRCVWTDLCGEGSQTVHIAAADSGLLLTAPHVGEVSRCLQAFLPVNDQEKIVRDGPMRDAIA
jgi:amino acid adenylation domain-containing protein